MRTRILAAIDFSEPSDAALRDAAALARRDRAMVGLCHVLPDVLPIHPLFPQLKGPSALGSIDLEHRARVAASERFAACAGPDDGRPPLDVVVLLTTASDAAAAIVERAESWHASLLVLGSHGRSGLKRALLGSVSEQVTRRAPCPVLVSRDGRRDGPVVVAIDLTAPSKAALRAAADEATARGVALVAVSALDVPTDLLPYGVLAPFGVYAQPPDPTGIGQLRDAATATLRAFVQAAGVDAQPLVVQGRAAAEIVQIGEELGAQLLVCATHGRTGIDRLTMGSVAEAVLRHAHCSVLVVRMESEDSTA